MSRRHSAVAIHKEGISEPENILVPTPSHFEKLYLAPEQAVAGKLRLTFGNPTPIALGGFLIANSSVGITLLGWHGAGADAGNAAALVGSFYYLAAVCLYAGGVGEWILGNTFPATVFFTFGGFWAAFGATITPFYNAAAGYTEPSGFYDTFAVFLIWMAVLCLAYLVCSLRTNICLFTILLCFVIVFPCLATSYYHSAAGDAVSAKKYRIVAGAFVFISTFVSWYLWFSMILESVDFPFSLPVGDLSGFIKGKTEKEKQAGMV